MNEIIAWIATNNILLIRIGFTAIVILMGVYVFRLLFVPKTAPAAETPTTEEKTKSEVKDEAKTPAPEVAKAAAPAASEDKAAAAEPVAPTKQQLEEIERLKAEVQRLTTQLAESEVQTQSVKPVAAADGAAATEPDGTNPESGAEAVAPEAASAATSVGAAQEELLKKIEHLEARLAEYEIIAEDISEIGQLRSENSELKKQLGGSGVAQPAAEAAEEIVVDSVPEATNNVEITAEDLINAEEVEPVAEAAPLEEPAPPEAIEATPDTAAVSEEVSVAVSEEASAPMEEPQAEQPAAASSTIHLKSEKEVSQTEKEMIAQFEEDLERKGS